ncbi:MAG: hypothetical protein YPKNTGVA_002535 [Candidatus Fervidibacter sp.]|jgi:hypothetical protein
MSAEADSLLRPFSVDTKQRIVRVEKVRLRSEAYR